MKRVQMSLTVLACLEFEDEFSEDDIDEEVIEYVNQVNKAINEFDSGRVNDVEYEIYDDENEDRIIKKYR